MTRLLFVGSFLIDAATAVIYYLPGASGYGVLDSWWMAMIGTAVPITVGTVKLLVPAITEKLPEVIDLDAFVSSR